jgi:hypothetical protein
MNATFTARTALDAYETRTRGRRISSMVDRLADGALAAGGVLLTNSVVPLGFNLPAGQVGMSAGGLLIAAAIAWMKRPVRAARVPVLEYEPAAFADRPLATVTPISAHRAHAA